MSDTAEFVAMLNSWREGWSATMGIRFVRATSDEVVAEVEIGPEHRQPYGIVHGGLYSGLIETVTSVGAALEARPRGQSAVGLENHTSFLKAVRDGVLRASARPLVTGRRTQVWEATVTREDGTAVATGRVRFLILDERSSLAGETIRVRPSGG